MELKSMPGHRLLFVDYSEGRPSNVVTAKAFDNTSAPWYKPGGPYRGKGESPEYYDIDWCPQYGLYCRLSGSGGDVDRHCLGSFWDWKKHNRRPTLFWASPEIVLCHYQRRGEKWTAVPLKRRRDIRRCGYKRLKLPLIYAGSPDPFSDVCEGETVYCEKCNERFPDYNECEHIDWCEDCSGHVYLTPEGHVHHDGGTEPVKCDEFLEQQAEERERSERVRKIREEIAAIDDAIVSSR